MGSQVNLGPAGSPDSATSAEGATLLHLEHVTKYFRSTRALDDVTMDVGRNEIVGLLGQNGAGKSTLTKIIVGVERPDKGMLTFGGRPLSPRNAADAARGGISIVYQENATVPDLQVYQWMYLGRERKNSLGILKVGEMKKECASILEEFRVPCQPEDRIRNLQTVSRKMIEIAKAVDLARVGQRNKGANETLVVLDEPTAPLTDAEREILFAKLKEMKRKSSFLFISHIIPEVIEIADRIYVLRDGKNSGSFDLKANGVKEQTVYQAMFGAEITQVGVKDASPGGGVGQGILKVSGLSLDEVFQDVSFEVSQGEILSIDGALHSGKMELAKTIAGIISQDGGEIQKGGKVLGPGISPKIDAGIGYFSGERSDELFMVWPTVKNITITVLNRLRTVRYLLPTIHGSRERAIAEEMVKQLEIHPPKIETLMKNLSGGNMQKVGLAKWLSRDPDLLILVNPTMGIDTRAKMEVYQTLLKMRAGGKSILLVSEDANELRMMSDRIIHIDQGKVTGIVAREQLN
ncbi:MAG TPA: sugar ABC transporter ATP-binding protein [Nitrososphaerales archaeon]|nr:sugar ABC transporter ATP-binding protein [Nitrososphaerales archaeon]